MEKGSIAKKCIPSLLLLIVGFIVAYISLEKSMEESLFIGWIVGGFIWGWSLTKKWFPNVRLSHGVFGGVLDLAALLFRMAIAFAVGIVAMPVGIIILIVTSAKAGKNAYKEASSNAESGENSGDNTNTQ